MHLFTVKVLWNLSLWPGTQYVWDLNGEQFVSLKISYQYNSEIFQIANEPVGSYVIYSNGMIISRHCCQQTNLQINICLHLQFYYCISILGTEDG